MLTPFLLWMSSAPAQASDPWQDTLTQVTKGVVSIRMDRPVAFEGKSAGNSYATGFVVDAEAGLILTNRHVVTPGPTTAKAVFVNQEEVDLIPIYRDPVHDFGVFRYDPAALRFHEPTSLRLRPDKAAVGLPIRVVGNDAGEQIAILDGTLARIERQAPTYGADFNDFNTFYLQASSSTSGGSSGSPVVDIDGDVVGLNAGSQTKAAAAFYLPLDRVVRALELIGTGAPVPRGTLQTRWIHTPYDALVRQGLSKTAEAAARRQDPASDGLLVAKEVLPAGPAHGLLQTGDILLEVDGRPVNHFVPFEAALDDNVGKTLPLVVERAGERVEVQPVVDDLHRIVPARYLHIGGAVLHNLSYHQARVMAVPVRGVYVAWDGFVFTRDGIPRKSTLVAADGVPLPDLDALVDHLAQIPDGQAVNFRWYAQGKPGRLLQTSVRIDRGWFPSQVCTRHDADGSWPCSPLAAPPEAQAVPPPAATFPPSEDRRAAQLATSMVHVENTLPYRVAGVPSEGYNGGGVIVDADRGWVLVDRDTVPIALGDMSVTFAGAVRVPAEIVALHPIHDLAIIGYDPSAVASLGLTSVTLGEDPAAGDKAWSITLERDGSLDARQVEIRGPDPYRLGAQGSPRFRDTNLEVWHTDPAPFRNGVLVDRKGVVNGFFASFSYNEGRETKARRFTVGASMIRETLDLAQGNTALRSLGWELQVLALPEALEQGLPTARAERLMAHDPERRWVLKVLRLVRGTGADGPVRTGDLVVAIDGVSVTRAGQVEQAIRGQDIVRVGIVRDGVVLQVDVPTEPFAPVDVDRVILWAGLRIHAPHRAARLHGAHPERPYIAWWTSGSPAGRAKVFPQRSIVSVDGVETPNMDVFASVVRELAPDATVRLVLDTLHQKREVFAIELGEQFWPTEELVWENASWARRSLRADEPQR